MSEDSVRLTIYGAGAEVAFLKVQRKLKAEREKGGGRKIDSGERHEVNSFTDRHSLHKGTLFNLSVSTNQTFKVRVEFQQIFAEKPIVMEEASDGL